VLNIHNCEQNSHYTRLSKKMSQGIVGSINNSIVIFSCYHAPLEEMLHLPLCSTVLNIDHNNSNWTDPLSNGAVT